MAVSYGKAYVQQPVGLLKIIELILLIVVLVILLIARGFSGYYGGPDGAIIYGLVMSLLILIFSLWKEVADAIDCVLKFQFIVLILAGLWLVITSAYMLSYVRTVMVIIAGILACIAGVLYFVDAFVSFQAYDVCK